METNVLLNQEQKDFLLEQVWLASKEFFEDVLLQNTDKIVSKLEDSQFEDSNVEIAFLLRYGNSEMQEAFCENYTPSFSSQLNLIKYVDSNMIYFNEFECISKDMLVCAFERGDKNIINNILQRPIHIDDFSEIQQLIAQRNDTHELAIFYNYQEDDAPCNFWEEQKYVDAIIENFDFFDSLSEAVVYKLIPHTNLHQQIIQKEFKVKYDMLIELGKVDAEYDILLNFARRIDSISHEELQKLYEHNSALIEPLVIANNVNFHSVLSHKNEDIVCQIADLMCDEETFEKYQKDIYSSPHGEKLVKKLIDEEWWRDEYAKDLVHHRLFDALYYWLCKQTKISSQHRQDIEYYIMKIADYRCVYAYIERFGLYDIYNEALIGRFEKQEEREKLLCLKYDHGGFHSQAGKNLWNAYCKHNIKEKRLSFWQKLQILFG